MGTIPFPHSEFFNRADFGDFQGLVTFFYIDPDNIHNIVDYLDTSVLPVLQDVPRDVPDTVWNISSSVMVPLYRAHARPDRQRQSMVP